MSLKNSAAADVQHTLTQRAKIYGSYLGGTNFRIKVMELIRERHYEAHMMPMDPIYEMMIWDLVNKLSRLAVSPGHHDTIHDIGGYAKLYEDVLDSLEDGKVVLRNA